ncbi:hypothetical protein BHE74_00038540, partial [Ensete ventricosum]
MNYCCITLTSPLYFALADSHPTVEETILLGDDLMLGLPSLTIPPEIASHVLEGVDLCDGVSRNLFLLNFVHPMLFFRHMILASGIEIMGGFHQHWSLHRVLRILSTRTFFYMQKKIGSFKPGELQRGNLATSNESLKEMQLGRNVFFHRFVCVLVIS